MTTPHKTILAALLSLPKLTDPTEEIPAELVPILASYSAGGLFTDHTLKYKEKHKELHVTIRVEDIHVCFRTNEEHPSNQAQWRHFRTYAVAGDKVFNGWIWVDNPGGNTFKTVSANAVKELLEICDEWNLELPRPQFPNQEIQSLPE